MKNQISFSIFLSKAAGCTRVIFVFLFVLLFCNVASAQLSSKYTFVSAATSTMTVISGGTSLGSATSDVVWTSVPIGFSFQYNCQTYTTVGVSANGFLWFGSGSVATDQYTPISSQTGESGSVDGIIALFAKNLTSGTVSYGTSGTAGSRIFKVQWINFGPSAGGCDGQIVLSEADNGIKLWWSDEQYGLSSSTTGQTGMRGNLTTDFLNRTAPNWCSNPAAGGANTSVSTISASGGACGGYPSNGAVWTWSYSNTTCCTQPTTNASAFSATGVNAGAGTATIEFTRGNGDGGVIVIAKDGTAPSGPANGSTYTGNAAFGNGTALGGGFVVYAETGADAAAPRSVDLTGLTSGHQYTFAIYEYNASATCYFANAYTGGFCIGAPAAATVATTNATPCPGTSATLSLTGLAAGSFYSYVWQNSSSSGSGYANSTGTGTNATYVTPGTLPSNPAYYVCQVTCPNTSSTTQSNERTETTNSFLNCYCTTNFSNAAATNARGLTNVNLVGSSVTISNSTGANLSNPSPYNLYSTPEADLSLNLTYSLKTTVGTATQSQHYVTAWIDYDQDGLFGGYTSGGAPSANENYNTLGVNERIVTVGPTNNVQTTSNFTVPAAAITGTTAMRVRYRYGASLATIGACQQFTGNASSGGAGEVEDYRVFLFGGCNYPTTQASSFVTDPSPLTTSCSVKFTRGNGDGGLLVVAKAGSAPTGPVSGTAYTGNAAFGSGSTTGTGSFAVYNDAAGSSGSQVTIPVTNLTPNTTYYFAAYEWNASSGNCYNLIGAPGGTCVIPLCIQPTTQVTFPSVTPVTTTTATLNWTPGSGNKTLILLKAGSAVSSAPALTGIYTDDLNYNSGAPGGSQIGSGNYVMFGDGGADNAATATITGLLPSSTYHYAMYSYYSATECYDLTSPLTGNFTTGSCSPSTQASNLAVPCYNYTTLNLTFDRGNGDRVIVLAHAGAAVNADPAYAASYTANAVFGTGSQIGTDNYVVYDGNDAGSVVVPISGLTAGVNYFFKVYEYNASPNCYNLVSVPTVNKTIRSYATYTSSTTAQVSTTVTQNTLAAQVINLQVVVGGGVDPAAKMNSITFNTTGSTSNANMISARVFYTGTSSTFSSATQFGSTFTDLTGNLTATGNFALAAGTNYFWIAYDVDIAATAGNVLDATIVNFNLTDNGGTSDRTPSPTAPAGSRSIIASGASGYCTPAHNNNTGDYIQNVVFAGNAYSNYSGNYTFFSADPAPTLTPGQGYTLSYYAYDVIGGGNAVFIDWNQDGDFADASEAIITSNYTYNNSFTVNVPANAVPGPTRLRIQNRWPAPGNTPCAGSNGSSSTGMAVDYPVIIGGGSGTQAFPCASLAPAVTTPVAYAYNASAGQLNATGTGVLWYTAVTGGTGSGTAPTPSTVNPGTTTYYVTQNTEGCEGPRTQIAVNVGGISCCTSAALSSVTAGSNALCPGTTTSVTANDVEGDNYTLTWWSGPGATGTNLGSSNPLADVGSGTYYAEVVATGLCASTAEMSTTITDLTNADVTSATADASAVCSGITTNITANGISGDDATLTWWDGPGGTGNNLGSSNPLTDVGPGTYYADVSGTCGSTVEVSATVALGADAGVTSATPLSNTVCSEGGTTSITANGVTGLNAVVTWWDGPNGTGNNLGNSNPLTGVGAGTYYADVSADCGATVEVSATITTGAGTEAGVTSVTPDAGSLCPGSTTDITANGITGTNAVLTWYDGPGGTGNNLGSANPLTGVAAGTYYAYVTADCGAPAELWVTVNALADAGIASATAAPVCATATADLVANGVTGTNAVVTWYTESGAQGSNLGTGTALSGVVGPGTYYAYVTADCGSPAEASVTVDAKVNVDITSVTPTASPICASSTTSLTADGVTGTNAVVTWYDGPGGTGNNLGNLNPLTGVGPGTYYARVTGDCGAPAEASAIVDSKINVSITSITPATNPVCTGNSTSLTANGVAGTNASLHWWGGSGGTGTDYGTDNPLTGAGAGTYYAQVTGDCASPVETSVTITETVCDFTYTVHAFLQGYYLGGNTMSPLLYLLGTSGNSTDVDYVTVELHNGATVYSTTNTPILQADGTISCNFSGNALPGSYYIVVKHRNSIETWSQDAQTVSDGGSYDFTSGSGQAYGSVADLGGGKVGIYSGDVDGDGSITSSDKSQMQGVLSTFTVGVYDVNDVTGDGFVDEDDYRILTNNVPLGISVSHP